MKRKMNLGCSQEHFIANFWGIAWFGFHLGFDLGLSGFGLETALAFRQSWNLVSPGLTPGVARIPRAFYPSHR